MTTTLDFNQGCDILRDRRHEGRELYNTKKIINKVIILFFVDTFY